MQAARPRPSKLALPPPPSNRGGLPQSSHRSFAQKSNRGTSSGSGPSSFRVRQQQQQPNARPLSRSNLLAHQPAAEDEPVSWDYLNIASRPLHEVIIQPVLVYAEADLSSDVASDPLDVGTRLHVLKRRELDDGSIRAYAALEDQDEPVGWFTLAATDGTATTRPVSRHIHEIIAAKPVLARAGVELSTEEVSRLPSGMRVFVIQLKDQSDGGQRACVVLEGQNKPLGWLTYFTRDGTYNLREVAQVEVVEPVPVSDLPTSAAVKYLATDAVPAAAAAARSVPAGDAGAAIDAAAAALAAATTQRVAAAAALTAAATVGSSSKTTLKSATYKANRPSKIMAPSLDSPRAEGPLSTPTPSKQMMIITPTRSRSASPKASPKKKASPDGHRRASITGLSGPNIMPSSEIRKILSEQKAMLKAEEEAGYHKPMSVRLGDALVGKNIKIPEMVRQWAKRGVEPISKMEFRQNVRKVLDKTNTKDIDALFEEMDDDGGGSLDVEELQSALKDFQAKAATAAAASNSVMEGLDFIRSKVASVQECLNATLTFENGQQQLEYLRTNSKVDAELGRHLLAKTIKITELVNRWDSNGNGTIERDEFRYHVCNLGIVSEPEDIDELFDRLDDDSNGSLDLDEMKQALKTLQDAAAAVEAQMGELKKESVDLLKAAKHSQAEVKKMMKAEKAAAERKAEEQARQEEERVLAEEAARVKAVKAAEAAKRRKEEEKAAFQAKIEERRKAKNADRSSKERPSNASEGYSSDAPSG